MCRDPVCAIRDPVCGIRDPVCAIRDPVCGIRDPVCAIRDPVSQIKFTDDRRVIARAGLSLDRATADSLVETLTRKEIIEAPADVALAHVSPGRPPGKHLIVLWFERSSDID